MNTTERDIAQKASAIQALAENFSTKKLSPTLLTMWLQLLSPYSVEQVQAGVTALIGTYTLKTLPPFAELKNAIDRLSGIRSPEETKADKAMEAEDEWQGLLEAISSVGSYGNPAFDPSTANVVRGFGGWRVVCQWTEDEYPWRHKEFLERWQAVEERREREERYALIAGQRRMIEAPGQRACALEDYLSRHPEQAENPVASLIGQLIKPVEATA